MLGKPWYERLDDDEYFDEIHITTQPRYKTSGMSGDEWRTSARITVKRKGHVIVETSVNKIKSAAAFLPWLLMTMFENDNAQRVPDEIDEALCFQPGCSKPAVTIYKLKSDYCRNGKPHELHSETRVAFCQTHLRRGDCAFKDADANYELVSGPGPDDADLTGAVISEASRVEVHVDSIEEIPQAVADVMKNLNE
jgi:hypothetical protein